MNENTPNLEAKIRHLEMIQDVVTRMAGNLFYLKGWTITLVVGLFALAATKDASPLFSMMAFLPLFVFWILDGYFLSMERSYRSMYNHVRKLNPKDINFDMNPEPFKAEPGNGWIASTCSGTIVWFYLPMVIAALLVLCKLLTTAPSPTN